MSKVYFNEHQRQLLESNPNVASVSDRAIQYTPEFKIKAVKENLAGKRPYELHCGNLSITESHFHRYLAHLLIYIQYDVIELVKPYIYSIDGYNRQAIDFLQLMGTTYLHALLIIYLEFYHKSHYKR